MNLKILFCLFGFLTIVSCDFTQDIVDCFNDDKVVSGCYKDFSGETKDDLLTVADGKTDPNYVNQALDDLFKDFNQCLIENAQKYCKPEVAKIVKTLRKTKM